MSVSYLEAISQALRDEMHRDQNVFCLGEDIGDFGGAFKVTAGLIEEFGWQRVWDTPLAEAGIIGCSVGAAIEGLRPVCEMQFADFIACGFDQLVNVAGKMYYRQQIAVPMVVRCPSGGGFSGGPFHSQNPEAWFVHAPGLKVVAPAFAEDAYGLLVSAIRDPNPVVFFEHKHLYRRVMTDSSLQPVPLGLARIARSGNGLSLISYGAMVHAALEATADVDQVEVIDLRSLAPLDTETVLGSVAKTGKVLLVQEANQACSMASELAAIIADQAFEYLDAPIRRLAAADTPIPFAPSLEQAVLPQVATIREAVDELLAY